MITLRERGFIKQVTDEWALDDRLVRRHPDGPASVYIGFDLTAPSLHVGSLIQIMALHHVKEQGHNPIVVFGGATTRIGDPTGKSALRPTLTPEEIEINRVGIQKVFDRLIGHVYAVNNEDFWRHKSFLDVLSDLGRHFTINKMLALDSVKTRLARQEPMTFLEFNYMVMQAGDFLFLNEATQKFSSAMPGPECILQIGGSDQWGNIVNGVDLIRRKTGRAAYGLTTPLMTNTAGEKMGKTAGGAIWLDPDMTAPFDFWQFWRNVEDEKVEEFLKLFTLLELHMIDDLMDGGINVAKTVLATEVTAFVHGREVAHAMEKIAKGFLNGDLVDDTNIPVHSVVIADMATKTVADVLVETGLVKSRKDADRMAANRGVRINGDAVDDVRVLMGGSFKREDGRTAVLAVGKKSFVVVEWDA
jgi:tyrosyl-tRNA synthetase